MSTLREDQEAAAAAMRAFLAILLAPLVPFVEKLSSWLRKPEL